MHFIALFLLSAHTAGEPVTIDHSFIIEVIKTIWTNLTSDGDALPPPKRKKAEALTQAVRLRDFYTDTYAVLVPEADKNDIDSSLSLVDNLLSYTATEILTAYMNNVQECFEAWALLSMATMGEYTQRLR
jgi:hypothetical protein